MHSVILIDNLHLRIFILCSDSLIKLLNNRNELWNWFNSKTVDTGIAEVVLSTKKEDDANQDNMVYIKSVRFIPAIQRNFSTSSVDDSEKERILSYLQGISNYAEIDLATGEIRKSDTDRNTQGGMNTSPTKKTEEVTEAQPGEITGAPENAQ